MESNSNENSDAVDIHELIKFLSALNLESTNPLIYEINWIHFNSSFSNSKTLHIVRLIGRCPEVLNFKEEHAPTRLPPHEQPNGNTLDRLVARS